MWLLVAACSFWAIVQVYETFFRFQTRARANRGVINALLGRNEFRLHVPPSIARMAARRGMRIQLAFLDREFNPLDGANLTDPHPSTAASLVVEEETKPAILQNYTVNSSVNAVSSAKDNCAPEASSSLTSREVVKEKGATGAASGAGEIV